VATYGININGNKAFAANPKPETVIPMQAGGPQTYNKPQQITIPIGNINLGNLQTGEVSESVTSIIVTSPKLPQPVARFGYYSNEVNRYPNDVVRFDLLNANNAYLGTNYRVASFSFKELNEGPTVVVNVEQDIQQLGYLAGRYNYTYRFHRNILGSGDGHKLRIQEISYNGLEVRVRPATSLTIANDNFLDFFQNGIFQIPKSQLLTNLFLFKDEVVSAPVFDFIQDKFTITESPYSIIFKLGSPLSSNVVVGDDLWLAQQVSDDYVQVATLTPPNLTPPVRRIAGANFDTIARRATQISTEYKDREDLLTANESVKSKLQEKLVSSSFTEGISINQDFRNFSNFINYSSAEARLQGFYYKLRQIETFETRIRELTVDLNGLPNSSATSSVAFLNNLVLAQSRRSAVIGTFDSYEKYLYYESASYVSNSFGEFYETTWPKSNNTKPYTNVPTTSSQGIDWFEGIIASASLYDVSNTKTLSNNTPTHIIEDAGNENYLTLLKVAGHYFDNILPYIQQINKQYDRNQSISEGLSKDLLYTIGENLGFEFENGSSLDDLWSYALGVDVTGSVNTIYQTTTEDTMKEIWKRIINNLPYLLKTKGTERGLRALINCFGIPDTILRIREYGGHEADFDTKTDLTFNRFYYALKVGYNGQISGSTASGYGSGLYGSGLYGLPAGALYGAGAYGVGAYGFGYAYGNGVYGATTYGGAPAVAAVPNPNQSIQIPWQALSQSGLFPETTELRVKMVANQTKDQTIFEVPNQWRVRAFVSGGYNYMGLFISGSQGWATASVSSSIYDNRWHSIAVRREFKTDSPAATQTYTLIAKQTNYLKVVTTETASLSINGTTSSSYNSTFTTPGYLWIPGSGSFTIAQSHSMDVLSGSVQEFRYWASALTDDILNNHTLTPTSFQGNTDGVFTGSTSSFATLAYRLALGSDSKKTIDLYYPTTSSYISQHPDQSTSMPAAAFYNFTSSTYESVIEENSLEWPDLGANRSISNKIRIDSTVTVSNQLYVDARSEKPLTDNYPIDSPRLGVYLSPSNEINEDIAEQFGGLSIDDFIGDPTNLELDNYPNLMQLQREYSKKYTDLNRPNQYSRILQHYNAALFQLLKRFVPYRANTQVGLVIEPTILERSKINIKHPTISNDTYTGSIILPEIITVTSGKVEDPTTYPLTDYVQEAVIQGHSTDYLTLQGSGQDIIPLNVDGIDMGSALAAGEQFEEVDGTIDLGVNGAGWNSRYLGSRYVYMTYASSGSNPRILTQVTASRYDEYEAVQPSILLNTYSSQFAPGREMYDRNIYYDRLFTGQRAFTASVEFSSSQAVDLHPLTDRFGLRLAGTTNSTFPVTTFNTSVYWAIDPVNGFYFKPYDVHSAERTGSFALDAFMYEPADTHTHDYLYRVTITTEFIGPSAGNPTLILSFGGFDSPLTQSIALSPLSDETFTFVTKAIGTELGVAVQKAGWTSVQSIKIKKLKVEPLNYRAQVQDHHLISSRGMINARYEGCKMTSLDYNVDSPDTIDNGPVVTIITVGGTVLTTTPLMQGGTFRSQ